MSKQPLVSVVIPAFNAAAFVRQSLDSILGQTYSPIEILVMDDASTDETGQILESYGPAVRHVRQPRNRGIYDNVNDGIALARGEYIATYHADDIYERVIVERQVDCFLRHPELGAVFCLDILVDAGNREYGRMRLPLELRGSRPLDYALVLNALLRYKNRFLVCPSAMVSTAIHRRIGVYRQDLWRNSSDIDMWLRIAQAGPIAILEEYLMRYRHFEGQSSQRYHRLRTEAERYFAIMDWHLERGARRLAHPEALADYEAHRAEDWLLIVVRQYIGREMSAARESLSRVHLAVILRSRQVERWRLGALLLLMRCLCRLPWLAWPAAAFYCRWQTPRSGGRRNGLGDVFAVLREWRTNPPQARPR
jgi:glycosyltransferase involved in cell wall biosynthesis